MSNPQRNQADLLSPKEKNQSKPSGFADQRNQNNSVALVSGRKEEICSASINLVYKQLMGTDEAEKVIYNMMQLARGLCKALRISCTEVCLVDKEFISLIKELEPNCKDNITSLMDLGSIFVSRCSFDHLSRVDKKSFAFSMMAREYAELERTRSIVFKNNGIYIPIISTWRRANPTVVGCLILTKHLPSEGGKSNPMKSQILKSRLKQDAEEMFKEDGIFKMSNSYLKEVMNLTSFFIDVCFNDLKKRLSSVILSKITELMTHFEFQSDIRDVLRDLRVNIPRILGFEECGLLVNDKYEGDSFYTINPSIECGRLKSLNKLDIYFYNPKACLSLECFKKAEPQFLSNPRSDPEFVEGFDNLTPVRALSRKLTSR